MVCQRETKFGVSTWLTTAYLPTDMRKCCAQHSAIKNSQIFSLCTRHTGILHQYVEHTTTTPTMCHMPYFYVTTTGF